MQRLLVFVSDIERGAYACLRFQVVLKAKNTFWSHMPLCCTGSSRIWKFIRTGLQEKDMKLSTEPSLQLFNSERELKIIAIHVASSARGCIE